MQTETITWHDLPDDGMPDAEITVLVRFTSGDDHSDTWPGWWSGSHWIDASTGDRIERTPEADGTGGCRVTGWSDMPSGQATTH